MRSYESETRQLLAKQAGYDILEKMRRTA